MRRRCQARLAGLMLVVLCWFLVCWWTYLNLLPSHARDSWPDMSLRVAPTAGPTAWEERDDTSSQKCPSVSRMSEGKWVTRALNETEQIMIDTYLKEARAAYKIPPTFQREDGRCGDVTYNNVTLHKHMWFRAICDPRGATPCCHTNSCLARPPADCRCSTCYDERQAVHAEYADWQAADPRCQVLDFNPQLACQVLDGWSLDFVGDSFIRHMFAALLLILTNKDDGALKASTPPEVKSQCLGAHQITHEACRRHLDSDPWLCHGKVKVRYTEMLSVTELPVIYRLLVSLRQSSTSLMVLGLGIHNNFNPTVVSKKFLHPFLNLHQLLSTSHSAEPDIEKLMRSWEILGWIPPTPTPEVVVDVKHTFPDSVNNKTHFGQIQSGGGVVRSLTLLGTDRRPDASYEANKKNIKGSRQLTDGHREAETWLAELYHKYAADLASSAVFLQTAPTPGLDLSHLRPRVLWVGAHAPGLLKSAKFAQQSAGGVEHFNRETGRVLSRWHIPTMDTFSFSNGAVSYDGTHYGWGVNKLKVNMLLTYIRARLSEDADRKSPGYVDNAADAD